MMQFINYFFASIISFLGLLIGIALARIAPEEQKPLQKYLHIVRKFLILLIFVFMIFYYISSRFYLFLLLTFFLFLIFIEIKTKDLWKKLSVNYAVFGILFFLSSKNINLFVIESSIILLYGLPATSLIYGKKDKDMLKILSYNIIFIIIANLLFFV